MSDEQLLNELQGAMSDEEGVNDVVPIGTCDRAAARIAQLNERVEKLEHAGAAIVARWDEDQTGHIEGALIDRMEKLLKEQP